MDLGTPTSVGVFYVHELKFSPVTLNDDADRAKWTISRKALGITMHHLIIYNACGGHSPALAYSLRLQVIIIKPRQDLCAWRHHLHF